MQKSNRIGVDLGKNHFQLHAVEREGAVAARRKLSRSKMRALFAQSAPCRVGMEACGSAHYWSRELVAMGHQVTLTPPASIKPYVKRGKNDAVDAAAICEAMSRPGMRFAPIQSADQTYDGSIRTRRANLCDGFPSGRRAAVGNENEAPP